MAAGSETLQSKGNAKIIFNKCTRPQIECSYFKFSECKRLTRLERIFTYEWWINLMVMIYFIGLYVIRKMVIRVQIVVRMEKPNIQVLWKYQMSIYVELVNNGYRYCSYACVWWIDHFRSVLFPIKLQLKYVLLAPRSFRK